MKTQSAELNTVFPRVADAHSAVPSSLTTTRACSTDQPTDSGGQYLLVPGTETLVNAWNAKRRSKSVTAIK